LAVGKADRHFFLWPVIHRPCCASQLHSLEYRKVHAPLRWTLHIFQQIVFTCLFRSSTEMLYRRYPTNKNHTQAQTQIFLRVCKFIQSIQVGWYFALLMRQLLWHWRKVRRLDTKPRLIAGLGTVSR
jgi:hypothetical protein